MLFDLRIIFLFNANLTFKIFVICNLSFVILFPRFFPKLV